MKIFKLFSFLFIVIGAIFSVISIIMLRDMGLTFKLFTAGFPLFFIGIGIFLFPGSNYTIDQFNQEKLKANELLSLVSLKTKIIWGVFGLVGFLLFEFLNK